jgi:hypothetical protein
VKTHFTLLLAGLLGLGTATQAQMPITLQAADYIQPLGDDSVDYPASNTPFAILATPASNASWNFVSTPYTNNVFFVNRMAPATPNPYAGSSFYTNRFFQFGGLEYQIERYNTLSNASLTTPGETILFRQALPLGSFTTNPGDSLVFPVQTIPYTTPERTLTFPTTYSSGWSTVSNSTTSFNLTVAAFGINNTPGQRRSQRSRVDSVMGWGNITLRGISNTGATAPQKVLQVRSYLIVRDSFFLNGQPAPPTLLGAFGLQQGQLDTTTRVFLYRTGETTPLVEAIWEGTSFGGTPAQVMIHRQRMNTVMTVGTTAAAASSALWPNPLRIGEALKITTAAGNWIATVVNALGQPVATQTGSGNAGVQTIVLPQDLPAGTYLLQLRQNGAVAPAQTFLLIP